MNLLESYRDQMQEREEWEVKFKRVFEYTGVKIDTINQYELWRAGAPNDVIQANNITGENYSILAQQKLAKQLDRLSGEPPYPAPKGKTWKTNGECKYVLVDDPDSFIEGRKKKVRNPMSHLTPKKKKRK